MDNCVSLEDRKFIWFYKRKDNGFLGHVWIYGEDELRKEIKLNGESNDYDVLQVIEIFDYKEIDIDEYDY